MNANLFKICILWTEFATPIILDWLDLDKISLSTRFWNWIKKIKYIKFISKIIKPDKFYIMINKNNKTTIFIEKK